MNSRSNYIPVTSGRTSVSIGSHGRSRVSSASSSYYTSCGLDSMRGNFSCRSGYGTSRSNFSSNSCSGAFISSGYRRRISTGNCPSGNYGGYPHLEYGDGLVEVGSGAIGSTLGGMGGDPGVCGVICSSANGKMMMQNLNDRLASYLDKVRCLEAENAELETRISDFYAKQGPTSQLKDYSHYYQQIEELKNQIICTTVENNKILLKIDNVQLNMEDVRQKLESERSFCQNVEADLSGLHPILDQLTRCKTDLEAELESLQEELCGLKKVHEEELRRLNKQNSDISVKISTCPGPDLKKILEEMRCKYEAMIDSNRKEVAKWYKDKLEEVNQEVLTSSKEVEDGNHKIIELRRQLQALEIDLQAQCSLRDTLQASLVEAGCRYNAQLADIQDCISCMEQQLAELHLEMEGQNREHKELLDIKNWLEREIQTYRNLLEEGQQQDHVGAGASHPTSAGTRGGITCHLTQGQGHHH
ncbi:keratin, type I cytoskeletal 19-like [Hemicordylus capensis]|uniref:keratin, type I cytoskeletal 19-like n=1 Tax=Hemicordylus capensis TaxID=884348 RepID=UPI002303EE50|nr:keratin, type I cytoskeletal 19-like [Hemicordylus capensis]